MPSISRIRIWYRAVLDSRNQPLPQHFDRPGISPQESAASTQGLTSVSLKGLIVDLLSPLGQQLARYTTALHCKKFFKTMSIVRIDKVFILRDGEGVLASLEY